MRENNFLLGYGERLTSKVNVPRSGGEKNPPYDFYTARQQIQGNLVQAIKYYSELPRIACPGDYVTAIVTMHPRYISKSEFPKELFEEVGLCPVGGRARKITPREWGIKKSHPDSVRTDEILVMGTRQSLKEWKNMIPNWSEKQRGANHILHIEEINAYKNTDKVFSLNSEEKQKEILLEVVLHNCDEDIINKFESFAKEYNSILVMDRLRFLKDIAFIPVYTTKQKVSELAQFSFIRAVRPMPTMRPLKPNPLRSQHTTPIKLPNENVLDSGIQVAIFDGGVPEDTVLKSWINYIEPSNIALPRGSYLEHGTAVTSAFLFGPIDTNPLPQPICNVDHIRVLDINTGSKGDFEYYDVLDRILEILDKDENKYKFINLSLGPDICVDDNDITRWTASLDERFAGGKMLVTVAAGNSGELDPQCGLNRIQPPSDAVNVISVGACDNDNQNWSRVEYSCVGPGRCPGVVKPDGVMFGGCDLTPFKVLAPQKKPVCNEMMGTSFAAPYALRSAVAVQAQLGDVFSPLALRALLIHRADPGGYSPIEVGWGKFETDYERLITCDDDEALVVFQGSLPVGDHLRAPIPLPQDNLKGMIIITATLMISPEVDPSFPNAYTRSGLEVAFRPNSTKFKPDKNGRVPRHPNTKSFFNQKNIYGAAEYDLREEKWEPCLKAKQRFHGKTLFESCFDIYYHHRNEGAKQKDPEPIPYALVVSIKAPQMDQFYDKVVRTYSNILIPLRPQVRIQVPLVKRVK